MTPIRETGLPPVTLVQALLPAAGTGDQPPRSAQWINLLQLGQRVIAEVQAHLTDGSFLVKVGDAATRMNLPSATAVGEKITLTVVDKSPLPTFILNANPPVSNGSSMSLSNTGKLIAAILQQSDESAAAPVIGKSPLMPQANLPAPLLANALQQTLTQSGLFYESHLNQWVSGQRTITELMKEPQATQTAQISANPVAANRSVQPAPIVESANISATVNSLATDAVPAAAHSTDLAINNPLLAHLVHQQLHTLEQNRFLWQGELWPGQTLDWEISDDTPRDNKTLPHSVWSSKVSFDLPLLGKVIAYLRLNGDQLTMQIYADSSMTLQQLQAHSGSLSNGLQTAGIPLAALQMKTHA